MMNDRQAAAIERLRAKGLGLAPHMVDGKVVSKRSGKRPPARAGVGAPAAERGPSGAITLGGTPDRSTGHTAPGVFVLWIPAPTEWLNLNDRQGHYAKARRVKAWREAARFEARRRLMPKRWGRVHVTVEIVKASSRAYDVHNLMPTSKACVDGLIDYQIVVDDSNEFLTGPDMRPGGTGDPGVYVTVTQLPEAHAA